MMARSTYTVAVLVAAGIMLTLFFGVGSSESGRDAAIGIVAAALILFIDRLLATGDEDSLSRRLERIEAKLDDVINRR
jgi:hypothetical protein